MQQYTDYPFYFDNMLPLQHFAVDYAISLEKAETLLVYGAYINSPYTLLLVRALQQHGVGGERF